MKYDIKRMSELDLAGYTLAYLGNKRVDFITYEESPDEGDVFRFVRRYV